MMQWLPKDIGWYYFYLSSEFHELAMPYFHLTDNRNGPTLGTFTAKGKNPLITTSRSGAWLTALRPHERKELLVKYEAFCWVHRIQSVPGRLRRKPANTRADPRGTQFAVIECRFRILIYWSHAIYDNKLWSQVLFSLSTYRAYVVGENKSFLFIFILLINDRNGHEGQQ